MLLNAAPTPHGQDESQAQPLHEQATCPSKDTETGVSGLAASFLRCAQRVGTKSSATAAWAAMGANPGALAFLYFASSAVTVLVSVFIWMIHVDYNIPASVWLSGLPASVAVSALLAYTSMMWRHGPVAKQFFWFKVLILICFNAVAVLFFTSSLPEEHLVPFKNRLVLTAALLVLFSAAGVNGFISNPTMPNLKVSASMYEPIVFGIDLSIKAINTHTDATVSGDLFSRVRAFLPVLICQAMSLPRCDLHACSLTAQILSWCQHSHAFDALLHAQWARLMAARRKVSITLHMRGLEWCILQAAKGQCNWRLGSVASSCTNVHIMASVLVVCTLLSNLSVSIPVITPHAYWHAPSAAARRCVSATGPDLEQLTQRRR